MANDINASRVKALVRNLERAGVSNALVSNETPATLADRLGPVFDRVLVDAPCSGEGMIRRDRKALQEWIRFGPEPSSRLQDSILEDADRLLRPGGTMVYATCTFSILENEGTVARFLERHPQYTLSPIPRAEGVSPGLFTGEAGPLTAEQAACTARIWPHRTTGDGHFCAMLQKPGNAAPETARTESGQECPEHVAAWIRSGMPLTDAARDRQRDGSGWWTGRSGGRDEGVTHWYGWMARPPLWTASGSYVPGCTGVRRIVTAAGFPRHTQFCYPVDGQRCPAGWN